MDVQAGIIGQLAGHSVAWFLDGKSLADITRMPTLLMAGMALASEVVIMTLAPSNNLYPNVVQAGAIYYNRGIPREPLKDPQVMGSIGSAAAKMWLSK
jgi:hypothetical protein